MDLNNTDKNLNEIIQKIILSACASVCREIFLSRRETVRLNWKPRVSQQNHETVVCNKHAIFGLIWHWAVFKQATKQKKKSYKTRCQLLQVSLGVQSDNEWIFPTGKKRNIFLECIYQLIASKVFSHIDVMCDDDVWCVALCSTCKTCHCLFLFEM